MFIFELTLEIFVDDENIYRFSKHMKKKNIMKNNCYLFLINSGLFYEKEVGVILLVGMKEFLKKLEFHLSGSHF